MVQQAFDANSILYHIKEGMKVYDSEERELGTVDKLYFGSSSSEANLRGTGAATADDPSWRGETAIEEFIKAAFADEPMPDTLRAKLLRSGFIRIDGKGIFAANRYVVPEQIASISEDRVYLKVAREALIKD